MRRWLTVASAVVGLVLVVGAVLAVFAPPPALVDPGEYDRVTVTAENESTTLGTVTARVADTEQKRYLGLSETDSLGPNEGMLFVHPEPGEYSYVMPEAPFPLSLLQRDMAFPLDIVFVDADGTITEIHEAAIGGGPYPGTGKYVLEVPRGWTADRGVAVGDSVQIPPEIG